MLVSRALGPVRNTRSSRGLPKRTRDPIVVLLGESVGPRVIRAAVLFVHGGVEPGVVELNNSVSIVLPEEFCQSEHSAYFDVTLEVVT